MPWNSTLKRHKPLRRGFIKRKTAIKKVSDKQKARLSKYYPIQREFLSRPENRFCLVCICVKFDIHIDDAKTLMKDGRECYGEIQRSSEVHHIKGRLGPLLLDTKHFCPSCRFHRLWPHDNQAKARSLGLLK